MFKKKGFTTAEVLITLGIAGVLAMMVLPMTNKLKPNREMMMFKKAYHETNRIVNELINDEDLYPDDNNNVNNSGFSNTSEVEYKGKTFGGASIDTELRKFCELFAAKINAKLDNNTYHCNYSGYGKTGSSYNFEKPNFITPDGIAWGLPHSDFNAGSNDSKTAIVVDVNGINKGDNCFEGKNCKNPDRFVMFVDRWGKTWVEGDVEKLYLNTTGSTKSYKDLTKN